MENPSDKRETGTVKKFLREKGYGFISRTSDGTDCFVHFKSIMGTGFKSLEEGQEVEFSIVQGQKGVEAKDVNILGGGMSQNSFFDKPQRKRFERSARRNDSSSSLFDFDETKPNELNSTNSTIDNLMLSKRTAAASNDGRQMGTVKRWSADRGFGFIRRPDGGSDLFCHIRCLKDGLRGLEEGQTVEFRIQTTEKGEEARDVIIVNENSEKEQTPSAMGRQTGTVKRWFEEKRFGFLQTSAGSDVFVHYRDLQDGVTTLMEGQAVEFELVRGDRGEVAKNVIISNQQ